MLFERDYTIPSSEVLSEYERYRAGIRETNGMIFRNTDPDYSLGFYRYISLFPNHELFQPLDENSQDELYGVASDFQALVGSRDTTERSILNFIRDRRAYFIVASILLDYDFGHHGRYLFREFPLGTSFAADFLIIGRGSGGHRFIFVEFENVYGRITSGDGDLGEVYRKGLTQIGEWQTWLDSNFGQLREYFNRFKGVHEPLPRDLIDYDRSRINFVVVAGRRSDYSERTYRIRRRQINESQIRLYHYDNLIDNTRRAINGNAY